MLFRSGKNNKTGENFAVVIGSEKKNDEGLTLTIRKSYSSRINTHEWTFGTNGLPITFLDKGYTLDGKQKERGGYGKEFSGKDGVKGFALEYTPAFAKRVIQYVKGQVSESVNEAGNDEKYVVIAFHQKGGGFVFTSPVSEKEAKNYIKQFPNAGSGITKQKAVKVSDARKLKHLVGKEALDESINEWDNDSIKKYGKALGTAYGSKKQVKPVKTSTKRIKEASGNFRPSDNETMIKIGGEKGKYWPWYFQKMDSTHFKMANDAKALNTGAAMVHHVGQHRGETYYNDLVGWLHGKLKSKYLFGKEYKGNG